MDISELKRKIDKEGYFYCWKEGKFPCFIYRFRTNGHWCGYVGVSKSHKLYGVGYSQESKKLMLALKKRKKMKVDKEHFGFGSMINAMLGEFKATPENAFNVHGGITFAGKHLAWDFEDYWFFGFDTVHSGDLNLSLIEFSSNQQYWLENDVYRDKEYVIKETKELARQISLI